jgi:hypothetical protein
VAMTHGVVKDHDGKLVAAVVVEDKEVAGHDLVLPAEPPPPAGQLRCAGAVEEDLCGP